MNFVEWMKSAGLSDKSANSYDGAINGRLTKWALSHHLTKMQISEISDLSQFVTLAQQLRQTPEFQDRNVTGKGMYAAALNNYQKYLIALGSGLASIPTDFGPHRKEVEQIESEVSEPFNPKGQDDARDRVLREVVRRRGQQKFRQSLIAAYGGCCAISGCPVTALLEAAHITPYLGPDTNSITNGLLLRADLHTLWDLGLIAVAPSSQMVWVSPKVNDPIYQALSGTLLAHPAQPNQKPSALALQQQWDLVHKESALAGLEA